MAEMFYGAWTVEVFAKDADFSQRTLDILRLSKAVTFLFKGNVFRHYAFLLQCIDHGFGLRGRHYFVLQSLQKNHRTIELVDVMNWRAFAINFLLCRIFTDQRIQIMCFKLMGIARECFQVANAV